MKKTLSCLIALLASVTVLPLTADTSSNELAQMNQWIQSVFLPKGNGPSSSATPLPLPPAKPGLRVLRQDYAKLEINQSCLKTPLHIGTKDFAHGLGINSVSEIEVTLPPGAQRFEAQVGVDNNHDTAGTKGSVEFIVEANGEQLFKSPVLRGGGEPLPVSVDISGIRTLLLKVTDGGDNPYYDQGDWADATILLANGEKVLLNDLPVLDVISTTPRTDTDLPFSFVYGGKSSYDLLKTWPRTVTELPSPGPGKKLTQYLWKDPATGLQVACELTRFTYFPAVDWVVRLTNTGKTDSLVIEKLLGVDMVTSGVSPVLEYAMGSTAGAHDFLPKEETLTDRALFLAAANGRSSGGIFPFFNLHDKGKEGGLMLGIGWSGQWESFFRTATNPQGEKRVHFTNGQQALRIKLSPGETIRSPRILLARYDGSDPMRGNNLLRQLLLAHYVPRIDGQVALPPIAAMTWFTYGAGGRVNEANQLEAIATMAPLGVEAFWLDAGWYGTGDWSQSVGTWTTRPDAFPRGLKVLGDASHAAGMKMVVWFEPERVQKNTTIAIEHPEFVHGGTNGGLFKLDDPVARKWMTELLCDHIQKDGIDILRIDYNLDPLGYWRGADTPDTQGLTENQYVQGLYAMWDEIHARFPHLLIDDCASGGRRIDLETVSRSIPLWRSDSPCDSKAHPVWDQGQVAGLSLWIPLHTGGLWAFDPYTARSASTAGTVICADLRDHKISPDVKRTIAEIKSLRECWLGDYYPLTAIDTDESHWMAWQFHRADLGKGFAMVFRRPKVTESTYPLALHGLKPEATYEVKMVDENKTVTMTGKDLASYQLNLPQAPASALLTYRELR